MAQNLHNPEVYDFRRYDRVWQRVAPDLEPYPGMNGGIRGDSLQTGIAAAQQTAASGAAAQQTGPAPAMAAQQTAASNTMAQQTGPAPAMAAQQTAASSAMAQQTGPSQAMMAPQAAASNAMTPRQEAQLPGASQDPCCMGSAAAEMLEVLTGFIEEELEDRRYFLALSRQAPSWARQRLRDMAAEEGAHAKRLMAAYYLITGQCYRAAIAGGPVNVGRWCPALRERYHMAACSGFNYARAADGTTDPCLAKLLNELSEDEYRHAEMLMTMLERAIQGTV